MGALTKADLAEMLFDELGLNKREAKEIVEMFYGEISTALESNDQVKISGSVCLCVWVCVCLYVPFHAFFFKVRSQKCLDIRMICY